MFSNEHLVKNKSCQKPSVKKKTVSKKRVYVLEQCSVFNTHHRGVNNVPALFSVAAGGTAA